jgi:hypothetical protein
MHTIPCLRCETLFERKRRGPVAHHCQTCRSALSRERARARYAARRAAVEEAVNRLPYEVSVSAREWVYESATLAGDKLPTQNDRMPPGSKTALGSEDGRSTYFTDLAETLDSLANASARHTCKETDGKHAHHTQDDCGGCFWDAKPHWCVDL